MIVRQGSPLCFLKKLGHRRDDARIELGLYSGNAFRGDTFTDLLY